MNGSNRLQILQMVEQGRVSVEDAIGMMSSPANPAPTAQPGEGQRWLRVRVSDLNSGRNKVSVNIPFNLMKWGFALGSRFAPELEGLDIDEMIRDLDQYAAGRIVEVEDADDNERVEIYIE